MFPVLQVSLSACFTMKRLFPFVLVMTLANCSSTPEEANAPAAKPYLAYFGTGAEDIYVSEFDPATGELTDPKSVAKVTRPNFLAIHPDGEHLYAACRLPEEDGQRGSVVAYKVNKATGALEKLNELDSQGAASCHLNVDATGKMVAVANYQSGSVTAMTINADKSLGQVSGLIQHQGSSVNPDRQKGPHAHSVNFSPDNRFVIAADLGLDKVLVYKVDPSIGGIAPNDPPSVSVAPGGGPRHFTFHPNGKNAYVINEMGSTVTAFNYDAAAGAFEEIQMISTLPEGYGQPTTTAEVLVHQSGKFLYGSNRGHDSIAVFYISDDGKLTSVEQTSSGGETPRNFRIGPQGKYLLAANQQTNNVVLFSIDQESGKLTATGRELSIPNPMCVRFVKR